MHRRGDHRERPLLDWWTARRRRDRDRPAGAREGPTLTAGCRLGDRLRSHTSNREGRFMAETGRLAAYLGLGKGFEIREYPVPDPKPGAAVIKVAIANVCGSDMHYWKGEQDMEKRGRQLPLNTGHEHMGTIHKLGAGVTTDSAGQPLREGDRVIYRYFLPCGRCRACLSAELQVLPHAPVELVGVVRGLAALPGRLRRVLLPRPEPRDLQDARRDHRRDGRRHQLRPHAGLRGARDRRVQGRAKRRDPGRGRPRRLRVRRRPRDGRGKDHRGRRHRGAARARQATSAPTSSSTCASARRRRRASSASWS